MNRLVPIVVQLIKGLAMRHNPPKAPPNTLLNGHNVRFRKDTLTIRPGLSLAVAVPITEEVAVEAANYRTTQAADVRATESGDRRIWH